MKRLLPSTAEWLFLAVLGILLLGPGGPQAMLSDGDTGWHIRAGEQILREWRAPERDLFSFSRPGEPWFAWEWLAEAIFALLHRWGGLYAAAAFSAALVALPVSIAFARTVREGAGEVAGLALALLAAAASSVHCLARPHLFTYALLPAALWLLESDRRNPGRRVWALVPLTAVWANLHGGFAAWLAALGIQAAGEAISGSGRARRICALAAACTLATVLNPYGIGLHRHIAGYLTSSWIRDAVEEFQAPRFRSEPALAFMALLFLGLMAAPKLAARREYGTAGMLLFWAQASLGSVRHIPIFAAVAAPAIGSAWGERLRRFTGDGPGGGPRPFSLAATGAAALLLIWCGAAPTRFPESRFPVAAAERCEDVLRGRRVLTSDQWADYLIYRFPGQKVFLDGRTDFYGRDLTREYATLMLLEPGWSEALRRHGFEVALLPANWPLNEILDRDPGWRRVHRDARAGVFVAVR